MENSVQRERKSKNMTQEELAKKVGVSRQTIIAIEKGGYVPSLELAMHIARVFGKNVNDLFTLKR